MVFEDFNNLQISRPRAAEDKGVSKLLHSFVLSLMFEVKDVDERLHSLSSLLWLRKVINNEQFMKTK